MAIQNDNTLVTKGDLKELYTDKIAPYLGGGINYYHTNRTGEELLNLYAGLSTDSPETDSTKVWTATSGAKVPFVKISGSLIMPSTGVITIPAGTRVELAVSLADDTASTNTVFGWYNDNTNQPLEGIKDTLQWTAGGAIYTGTTISQWTNNSDEAVNISYRVKILNVASKLRYRYSHLSVQEVGRIVDPVKYVSNNSDLQETPVGNIISYMGNTVPKHYLACDGATYNIGTYPELEAFIIDEFGSINYFGGDGTTTWAVPDLRGEFLRGTGTNSHTNQGNGANVGVHQDSTELPAYYTGIGADNKYYIGYRVPNNATSSEYNIINKADKNVSKTSAAIYGNSKEDIHGTASTSNVFSTIRPTNTSVKYCIKYESTFHAFFANAAYKVSVKASIPSGTSYNYQILDSTDITGDTTLIDGNYFVTPLDGWYIIGQQGSTSGAGNQSFGLEINGDSTEGWNSGIGYQGVIYLNKGDRVRTFSYNTTTAHNCYINFCLLESNYNPTIVSADSVYSENEQMIGYWKDGKPLYQKTVQFTTLPNQNIVQIQHGVQNVDFVVEIKGIMYNSAGASTVIPRVQDNSTTLNIGVDASRTYVQLKGRGANFTTDWAGAYVTFTYTKTTDTASTLQVENSLLLNRPDLWTPGTEYSFGSGLYGKRLVNTALSIAAKSHDDIVLESSATAIVTAGGTYGNTGAQTTIGSSFTDSTDALCMNGCVYKASTGGIKIRLTNISWSQNITQFDVWVTYKK